MPKVVTSPPESVVVTATRSSTSSVWSSASPTANTWLLAAWCPSTTPTASLMRPPGRRPRPPRPAPARRRPGGPGGRLRRTARSARRRSPMRWRRRHSSPAIGDRFCGARGSRWGRPANRGSSAAARSASRAASTVPSERGASPRRMPAQPSSPTPGSRWYQLSRSSPIANSGVRSPTRSATTARASAGGRYMRWWLLMAPTTGPPTSRTNDSRPSSTTSRSGRASSSASASSICWRNSPTRRATPVASLGGAGARLPREAPHRRQRQPAVADRHDGPPHPQPHDLGQRPGARQHRAGGGGEGRARARLGVVAGRDREPGLDLLGAVDEGQLAARARAGGTTGAQGIPSTEVSTGAVSESIGSKPGPYDGSATWT